MALQTTQGAHERATKALLPAGCRHPHRGCPALPWLGPSLPFLPYHPCLLASQRTTPVLSSSRARAPMQWSPTRPDRVCVLLLCTSPHLIGAST